MTIFDIVSDADFEPFKFLLPLALILLLAKLFSLLFKKLNIPQVIGCLLAGVILGAVTLIPGQTIFSEQTMGGIDDFAKIGVILIMFSAGLETDLHKVKETGVSALVVTAFGVLFPLVFGFAISLGFWHTTVFTADGFSMIGLFSCLFYGVLLTATSVSITVTVLKEIGKLDSKVGACLISAAVLDDIIGIILLSLIVSLSKSGGEESSLPFGLNFGLDWLNIVMLVVFILAFFGICVFLWKPIRKLFTWLNNKWPHHRRIPIFGFGFAFLFSWAAQYCFGVADITGAFMAGLILSGTGSKQYIDSKADSEAGIIFGPIFFASIGMMLFTQGITFDSDFLYFSMFGISFVIVGLLGKFIGAGLGGLLTHFGVRDSAKLGIGMMARAEVLIVCAKMGIDEKVKINGVEQSIIDPSIMIFILALIILSSVLTPILLKLLYKKELKEEANLTTVN
ncbi:MAG: cation:proton antiporter [Erysipelotrichaceae bacterium]|jgi:Kef-type K+ transport system membrane component KefB|nr:cation:proton antiporter [Erysipelotrichaceae bacterium]